MISSIKVTPPNALILIEDEITGVIPDSIGHSIIASTDSCIAVGCMAEDDGETEISIRKDIDNVLPEQKIFDGILKTPTKKLVFRTILGETLFKLPVPCIETRLIIEANDLIEPDKIVIFLS